MPNLLQRLTLPLRAPKPDVESCPQCGRPMHLVIEHFLGNRWWHVFACGGCQFSIAEPIRLPSLVPEQRVTPEG